MSEWIKVIDTQTLADGKPYVTVLDDITIVLLYRDNGYFAFEDFCPHQGLPLSDGAIEGHTVTCPYHGAKFCIKTGKVQCGPAMVDLITFPTRIQDNMVYIAR